MQEPFYEASPFKTGLPWDVGTGVFNLMELLQFYAGNFCRISGLLGQSWVLINKTHQMGSEVIDGIGSALGDLKRECERLGLLLTLAPVQRLIDSFDKPRELTIYSIARQLADIQMRLIDELEARYMLAVPPYRVTYYRDANLFGEEVSARFPSARTDVEEAGKCLALSRNTACMFHLMRVTESGLRALASGLGDSHVVPASNPSWESLLKKCDTELSKPIAHRSAEWRTDDPFFSTAVANLRAVKNAWRNPTMHIDQIYSDEIALEVWNAVRGFMRHLATKLCEVSTTEVPK